MHSFLGYRINTINTFFYQLSENPGFLIINLLKFGTLWKNIMDPESFCRNPYELKELSMKFEYCVDQNNIFSFKSNGISQAFNYQNNDRKQM